MLHIHLDAIGGVAGDMFIAAVCDAFPHLREPVLAAQRAAGLPDEVTCAFLDHRDHALTGLRFDVHDPHDHAHRHAHAQGLPHHHDERPFAQIRALLRAAPLKPAVIERAVAMFTALAEVEGQIHGVPTEDVSFHELGGWDSIADMVGAAVLIDALQASWSISALPLGRGRVKTAHGALAVPSPATTKLLAGYEFIDDGFEGERVTPTGATIVKHIAARQKVEPARRRLVCSGQGFGTKVFFGLSNVLRVMAFEKVEAGRAAGEQPLASALREEALIPGASHADTDARVAHIAFEIDDQTPEDLAIALENLRAQDGVLDVLQIPAFGKKGRMVTQVQILAACDAVDAVAQRVFAETTTLGLRWHVVSRKVLVREAGEVEVDGQRVRTKVAQRGQERTLKVENDDLREVAGGRAARERLRRAAEDKGLNDG